MGKGERERENVNRAICRSRNEMQRVDERTFSSFFHGGKSPSSSSAFSWAVVGAAEKVR
jgi:hypothetical protein